MPRLDLIDHQQHDRRIAEGRAEMPLVSHFDDEITRLVVEGVPGVRAGADDADAELAGRRIVRFLAADGNHGSRTEAVIRHVQESGVAWFGPATWNGMRVMRVSVCDWRTSEEDVRRTLEALG